MRASVPCVLPLLLLSYLWYPGEDVGGVLGTPVITSGGPPPCGPQKTPQEWRLQGVAKRLSGWPSEGIVEHSGLENDVKMTSQKDHFGDFRGLG